MLTPKYGLASVGLMNGIILLLSELKDIFRSAELQFGSSKYKYLEYEKRE
jgi:hypothetical protein